MHVCPGIRVIFFALPGRTEDQGGRQASSLTQRARRRARRNRHTRTAGTRAPHVTGSYARDASHFFYTLCLSAVRWTCCYRCVDTLLGPVVDADFDLGHCFLDRIVAFASLLNNLHSHRDCFSDPLFPTFVSTASAAARSTV